MISNGWKTVKSGGDDTWKKFVAYDDLAVPADPIREAPKGPTDSSL